MKQYENVKICEANTCFSNEDLKFQQKRFIWNLNNCECECDKSSNISEYLNYESGKCRKIKYEIMK